MASHDEHRVKLFVSNEQQTTLQVISIPLCRYFKSGLHSSYHIILHSLLSPIYSLFFTHPPIPLSTVLLLVEMSGVEEGPLGLATGFPISPSPKSLDSLII